MSDSYSPRTLRDKDFEPEIRLSRGLHLVDFWAPWCNPCRMLAPILDEVAADIGPDATIWKLNIDENPNSALKYGIKTIPTMLIFLDGELVETIDRRPKDQILAVLRKYVISE